MNTPQDFVIATGKQYSVRQFIEWTAAELGMSLRWEGSGVDEVGYAVIASEARQSMNPDSSLRAQRGNPEAMDCRVVPPRNDEDKPIVRIDPRYFRPTEVETLLGDPSVQLRTELKVCPASFRLNKNSAGCRKSPRKKCAKRWSPMTWPKPNSMRCSKPTAIRLM